MEYIFVALAGAVLVALAFKEDNAWNEWEDDNDI
jgi:hypothetical protein